MRDKSEGAEALIRPLEYPIVPGAAWALRSEGETLAAPEAMRDAREEAFARQLEAVRRDAVEQGRKMAAAESSAWRRQCAEELCGAIEAFRAGQDSYLAQVEKEVVRLALAIAERILHRESQVDPLFLSGAVRKSLGQVSDSTEVRLRVPAEQRELWNEVVRLMPGLPLRPSVIADAELATSAVVIESSLGTVDLSLSAQLEEIERGFFDRGHSEGRRLPEPDKAGLKGTG